MLCDDCLHADICENTTQGNCEWYLSEKELKEKWIPVSERLPDDREETYWVCTDGEYQCQCRWTDANMFWTGLKTGWHWCLFDIPQYQKVIAWQPLPEPYKEGGADMRKPNCVRCDHFGKCEGCEKRNEE